MAAFYQILRETWYRRTHAHADRWWPCHSIVGRAIQPSVRFSRQYLCVLSEKSGDGQKLSLLDPVKGRGAYLIDIARPGNDYVWSLSRTEEKSQ
jgi:hypothetical protein